MTTQFNRPLCISHAEISYGAAIVFQLITGITFWMFINGSSSLISTLPNWALAMAGSGATCVAVTALILKQPKLFFGPLVAIGLLSIQIGSAGVLSANPSEAVPFGRGQLPSLNEIVETFSWLIAFLLALGGVASGGMLFQVLRSRGKIVK